MKVTIHEHVLNVTCQQRHGPDGLEQWVPTFTDRFPLGASVAAAVLGLWHIRPVDLSGTEYSQAALLALISQCMPTVAAVDVSKQERAGELDGCLIEVVDLLVDGRPLQTVAVGGEDAACVLSALRLLGLDRFENVNYVKALQRILRSASRASAVMSSPLLPRSVR